MRDPVCLLLKILLAVALVMGIALLLTPLVYIVSAQDSVTSTPDPSIPYAQENPGLPVEPSIQVQITSSGRDSSESSTEDYEDEWALVEAYFTEEKWELDKLLFDLGGKLTSVREVAWFLGMHGYLVTEDGRITLADSSQWQIVIRPDPGWPDVVRVGAI